MELEVHSENKEIACTSCKPLDVPDELRPFLEASLLLPGESLGDYEALRRVIVEDVQPRNNIEWLWVALSFPGKSYGTGD